mmetsp:Transcript_45882/g.106668  ORF Transcript_45882/g.106668 Transcript_45882/m.106668 type:complete len:608 (+) Transcript_45882:75-1898(+)
MVSQGAPDSLSYEPSQIASQLREPAVLSNGTPGAPYRSTSKARLVEAQPKPARLASSYQSGSMGMQAGNSIQCGGSIGLPVHAPGPRPSATPRSPNLADPEINRVVRQSSASLTHQSSIGRWHPPTGCQSPVLGYQSGQSPPPGKRTGSQGASHRTLPLYSARPAGDGARTTPFGVSRNSVVSAARDGNRVDSDQGSTSDAVSGLFMQLESFKEEQERRLKFMELSVFGQLQDQTKKNILLETFIKEQLEKVVNTTTAMGNSFDERLASMDVALEERQASINKLAQKQQAHQSQLAELAAGNHGGQDSRNGKPKDPSWSAEREVVVAALVGLRETVQQMRLKVEEQGRRAGEVHDVLAQLQTAVPRLAAAASKYDELQTSLAELQRQVAGGPPSRPASSSIAWPSFGARGGTGEGILDLSVEVQSSALDELSRNRLPTLPDSIRDLQSQTFDQGANSPVSIVAASAAELCHDLDDAHDVNGRLAAGADSSSLPCFGDGRLSASSSATSLVDVWRKDLEKMRAELKGDVCEMLNNFQQKSEEPALKRLDLSSLLPQQDPLPYHGRESCGASDSSKSTVTDAMSLSQSKHGDTIIYQGSDHTAAAKPTS